MRNESGITSRANRLTPRSRRPVDLGRTVAAHRVDADMTQAELAVKAGVSRKTVCRLEKTGRASSDSVFAVEAALGLAPSSLVPTWDHSASPRGSSAGQRMRALRRSKRLTLTTVADCSNVDIGLLSRLERGVEPDCEARWVQVLAGNHTLRGLMGFRTYEDMEDLVVGQVWSNPANAW